MCVVEYCSSLIINENQLSSAHDILNATTFKLNKNNNPPTAIDQMAVVDKASSYLSIVHINITSCRLQQYQLELYLEANIIVMKIAKKKVKHKTPLVNP